MEPPLSDFELERYSRQIRIEGFGLAGQQRLKQATVLISRVGGVGGAAAMMLARAGVGRMILAHGGVIVPEYLNRMHLAYTSDVGRPCMEVFVERLAAINPAVEVVPIASNITAANVAELVQQADLVVDGAPLFEERYLMNQEAVRQAKPLAMGAMYSTEGYVTTIMPRQTPCLACLFARKPDYWNDISVFPAIGPGPLIVGGMLAMEAIKVLAHFGKPLYGSLWHFDLETAITRQLRVERNPQCVVCGEAQ